MPSDPCRCGHTGDGPHRCHAGRPDPATGEDGSRWCSANAVPVVRGPRFVAQLVSLSGMQMKVGAKEMPGVTVYYCPQHYRECFGVEVPDVL